MSDTAPENGQPGDKAIMPLPATVAEAETRINTEADCSDWYYCNNDVAA